MSIFKTESVDAVLEKALGGERINSTEALRLYNEGDFLKIMGAAREMRNRRTDSEVVTYTSFRVVNYTTFCNVDCTFCSFQQSMDSPRGKTLSAQEVVQKMEDAVRQGADQMFLQGGVNPELPFQYYIDILQSVRQRFGADLHIRAFSPVELLNMEKISGESLEKVLELLRAAGMDSVPGAGAEILTERMRGILSPKKATTSDWLRVMETCHKSGLPGSANIVFGSEETREEFVEHLQLIRDLQDKTGGFRSFVPWTFQQQTKRFRVRSVPPAEYLKALGICRLFLDNIPHMETSLMVLGPVVGSLALHGGADDISSVVIEENVLKSHAFKSEESARDFIQQAGFRPVKRDLLYRLQKDAAA